MKRLLASAAVAATVVASAGAQAHRGLETFDAAWTIIRDSHFDPAMNGVDWNAVRDELRPKAEAAASDAQLRAVIRDMLGRLGQSHFVLIPAGADASSDGKTDFSAHPGFETMVIGRDVVVTRVRRDDAAAGVRVQPGWLLESIDSRPVQEIVGSVSSTLPPRLFLLEAWRAVETRLRGPDASRVQLVFRDGSGRAIPLALERRPESGVPARVGNLPMMFVRLESERRRTPDGAPVGLIRFNIWMAVVDSLFGQAMDDHRSSEGIVIDLRGNPGGLAAMLMGIAGHFLTERVPLGVMKTRDTELKFPANPRLVNSKGERVAPFAGPVAILVDGLTGSASECFAGGMQAVGRARVFGQTSMGQALPAVFRKLPNDDVLIHAYGDFVTSNGTRLEGRGVIPDEEVPLSRDDLLAGHDRPLERALQWIDRERIKQQ